MPAVEACRSTGFRFVTPRCGEARAAEPTGFGTARSIHAGSGPLNARWWSWRTPGASHPAQV